MKESQLGRLEERSREAYRVAHEIFRQGPDWVTFLREVLGEDGVVRRLFRTPEAVAEFEKSPEYAQIQQMLAALRSRREDPNNEREPTRVITVRLPKTLHELLRAEAHRKQTSMNKLCIAKLLQAIADAEEESQGVAGEDEQECELDQDDFPGLPGLQDFDEREPQ
jgi:predicted HicB family RNase H-like nuclease